MKINKDTKIVGDKIVLVPYLAQHVEKYHQWMKDPELQELTASEPLSLEDEYKMQDSWQKDEDKCTFIVLDKALLETTGDEIKAMIGDTNVFFSSDGGTPVGEVEIMVAEKDYRRGGRGSEAMLFMLRYCAENIPVKTFQAKIGLKNTPSLAMFKNFHFEEVSRSEVFNECTLQVQIEQKWTTWLLNRTEHYSVQVYVSNKM